MNSRIKKLLDFLEEIINYFLRKIEGVDRDRYFADRDIRNILDKTIKDTILACHEFLGDTVLKIAPLTKHRNDTIHQYLKINWQNIFTIKSKIPDIKEFKEKTIKLMAADVSDNPERRS